MDKLVGGLYSIRLKKLKRGGVEALEVVGIVIGELYECFLVILFLSLTWLASTTIEFITAQVAAGDEVGSQVIKWRRMYHSVSKFIGEVDAMFGPALIVLISKQFVFFVVYSFKICQQVAKNGPMVFSAMYTARNLFLMLMLIIGAERMKHKVSCRFPFQFRLTSSPRRRHPKLSRNFPTGFTSGRYAQRGSI